MSKENKTLDKQQNGNDFIADVSGSPSFEDWLNKYFETPKMKMMYKRKDGKGEFDREKLIKDYKRAYKVG